jgi:hypothetical protein
MMSEEDFEALPDCSDVEGDEDFATESPCSSRGSMETTGAAPPVMYVSTGFSAIQD